MLLLTKGALLHITPNLLHVPALLCHALAACASLTSQPGHFTALATDLVASQHPLPSSCYSPGAYWPHLALHGDAVFRWECAETKR